MGRRGAVAAAGACLGAGIGSAAVASTPAYDAWSWLGWGRELVHGRLVTSDGPSWKPLAALAAAPVSAFGQLAPDVWVALMRSASAFALVLAFLVARRLAPPGAPGVVAGLLAALGLALAAGFDRQAAVGYSEGLLLALVLGALLAELDGRPRLAVGLGLLALGLRPEVAPVLVGYLAVRGRRDRRLLALGLAGLLLVAALWVLPEWWGSGDPWGAAARAARPRPWTTDAGGVVRKALTAAVPAWTLLAALGGAALRLPRARGLVLLAAASVAEVAVMAELGFTGNTRYLLPAAALLAVAGGAAWGHALAELDTRAVRARPARALGFVASRDGLVAGLLTLLVLAGAGAFAADARDRPAGLRHLGRAVAHQRWVRAELPAALDAAGGRSGVARCAGGALATEEFQAPMVAWYLGLPLDRVRPRAGTRGTVLRVQQHWRGRLLPAISFEQRLVAEAGPWEVLRAGCDERPS